MLDNQSSVRWANTLMYRTSTCYNAYVAFMFNTLPYCGMQCACRQADGMEIDYREFKFKTIADWVIFSNDAYSLVWYTTSGIYI